MKQTNDGYPKRLCPLFQSKVTGSKSNEDIDAAFKEATEDQEAGSPMSESAPGSDPPTEKVPL